MTVSTEQYVMVVHGTAIELFEAPRFLAEFDLEVPDDTYGWGTARLVDTVDEAMRFDSMRDVYDTWKRQSKSLPWRPSDGKPNRPLSRYSIEARSVRQAQTDHDPLQGLRP